MIELCDETAFGVIQHLKNPKEGFDAVLRNVKRMISLLGICQGRECYYHPYC